MTAETPQPSLEIFDGPDMWVLFVNGLAQQKWLKLGLKLDGRRYRLDCHVSGIRHTYEEDTWIVDFDAINFASFVYERNPPKWFVDMMNKSQCFFRVRYLLNGRKGEWIPTMPDRDHVLVSRDTVHQLHIDILPGLFSGAQKDASLRAQTNEAILQLRQADHRS